jgi:hypothetical protein
MYAAPQRDPYVPKDRDAAPEPKSGERLPHLSRFSLPPGGDRYDEPLPIRHNENASSIDLTAAQCNRQLRAPIAYLAFRLPGNKKGNPAVDVRRQGHP